MESNRIVIITLQGGLGNQMFQYATAKCIAINTNSRLYLDTSFLDQNTTPSNGFTPRSYELFCFNLKDSVIEFELLEILTKPNILSRILGKLNFKKKLTIFYEKSLNFKAFIFEIQLPILLNGYFQSEKYFKSIKGQLFEIFKFPSLPHNAFPFFLDEIQNTLSVAVHVRRGDFVTSIKTNAYHGVCEKIYYTLAMQEIQRKIKSCKFFFFSDDHEWVRQNLIINDSTILVETNNMPLWYDMYLMTQCKHNIIANSSYSWWGAWLNQNESKIVIAPKKWFADDKMNMQTSDLIPKEWIRL